MKKNLTFRETVTITSMLFGLFFGAGNLIFPVSMGQQAGSHLWPAVMGLLVTGVGLPLLGVVALGISRCGGLAELSSRVGRRYGVFFTCALYLTIGPFFAVPRCATVPFSVGVQPLLGTWGESPWALAVFSLIFFGVVLVFSLRPNGILTWVGKVLNPVFLVSLGILVGAALLRPMGEISQVVPEGGYVDGPFFSGFLAGYNTLDALAGLAFGIVVVNVVRGLGITEPEDIARNTAKAGIFSCLLMGVIYIAVAVVGTQSRGLFPVYENGGVALAQIANHYFGKAGAVILAVTVTFACLKTAVGLITSCAETFVGMFPKGPSYSVWTVLFCVISFLIANLGLSAIIQYSLPVLMFLYPLAITLILLTLFSKWFQGDRTVYAWVTGLTLIAAVFDFLKALPESVKTGLHLDGIVAAAETYLPLFSIGLGWVLPAAVGLVIGLILYRKKQTA